MADTWLETRHPTLILVHKSCTKYLILHNINISVFIDLYFFMSNNRRAFAVLCEFADSRFIHSTQYYWQVNHVRFLNYVSYILKNACLHKKQLNFKVKAKAVQKNLPVHQDQHLLLRDS
jgi:hypothetical protein